MRSPMRSLALSVCALTLASCSDFSSQSRSWWLRYHPEENEAVYVEVLDGVTAGTSGVEPLRKLVKGWRRYPPEGGLLALDLDEEPDWEDAPSGVDEERLRETLASLRREVVVTEAGLFRVGAERAGFYRVTHIKDLSVFLRDANELVNVFLYEEWKRAGIEVSSEYFELSEETKARWLERAKQREPWVTRAGRTFTLDLPMTEAEAAGFLRAVLEEAEDFDPDTWFMRALSAVRVADGSLRLSFAPAGARFQDVKANKAGSQSKDHAELIEALEMDPGFEEFDRAKLLERVK